MNVVELRRGALRTALRPDVGGCIAGLWHDGVPVLRSVEPAALDAGARASACFPLVPYSNRLADRRFRWQGVAYTTASNFDASPHSLHGVGWRRAWQVGDVGADHAALHHAHRPDADWPFAFTAEQSVCLHDDALELRLAVTSDERERAAPVGLGWHPYFPKRAASRVRLDVTARWERDARELPCARVPQGSVEGAVAALDLDHGFDGWRGAARIDDEAFALRLHSTLDRVVVFTPPARAYFCIEPVSHVANAINTDDPAAHGLVALPAGGRVEATLRLEITPRSPR